MIAARAFVGAEASYATLSPAPIDEIAPPKSKSRWMAIYSRQPRSARPLATPVGGAVLREHGWRAAFFVAGGPGLAVALLCLFIAEPPRQFDERIDGRPTQGLLASVKALSNIALYRNIVLG